MNRRAHLLLVNAALMLAAAATLFPLLWMLSVSFMPSGESSSYPPPLLPSTITIAHYRALFASQHLGRYFFNSLVIATCTTVLAVLLNGMAGYAFAALRFPGRKTLYRVLIAGLQVPAQVAMIPLFGILKYLGLIDTYAAVIIPGAASIFGIFLVRQYALSIPGELLDAARVDGAGEWRIFVSVVLPLLRPILVTLGVLVFLTTWNDFMWPLIALSGRNLQTLPIALASLSRDHAQDNELMMAGAVVTVLPVLALFLALQRFYLRGITMGSVKG